jgi:hypothetical protein
MAAAPASGRCLGANEDKFRRNRAGPSR